MSVSKLAVNLRIAVVQLNPQIGQVKQTVARTWELLNRFKRQVTEAPDIVVFPEFALTGYNFHSRDHILPYCTYANSGPSYELACKVSEMFQCYTVIGYPEKTVENKLYNSAVVVDAKGQIVFNYRKSFLYHTDEEWGCLENPRGFQTFPLTFKNNARDSSGNLREVTLKTSLGICMDLSPYQFKSPFHDFEFATYNLDQAMELIICPMAWLHSISAIAGDDNEREMQVAAESIERSCGRAHIPLQGSQGQFELNVGDGDRTARVSRSEEGDSRGVYGELDKPDMSNVNYWLLRFLPFLYLKERDEWPPEGLAKLIVRGRLLRSSYVGATLDSHWGFKGRNAVLAVANRCGIEEGKTVFAGSSGIYKFNGERCESPQHDAMDSTNHSVELEGNLGKGHEGILCREVRFQVVRS